MFEIKITGVIDNIRAGIERVFQTEDNKELKFGTTISPIYEIEQWSELKTKSIQVNINTGSGKINADQADNEEWWIERYWYYTTVGVTQLSLMTITGGFRLTVPLAGSQIGILDIKLRKAQGLYLDVNGNPGDTAVNVVVLYRTRKW